MGGLTVRQTLLGTLHRDSLTWRPSLHLWNSLNVSDQPDWSRLSFLNEVTVTHLRGWAADLNTNGSPNWPLLRQIQFTHVTHSSISFLQTSPQTIIESVTTTMWFLNSPLLTVSSVSNCCSHWTYHTTLVMFRSVQFLEIIICNASNARIGLPIVGANS